VDQTIEKLSSYLQNGGNTKFGAVSFPKDFMQDYDELSKQLPNEINELWTFTLSSIEKGSNNISPYPYGGYKLSRMKMWCPYLSTNTVWPEEMQRGKDWELYLELIRNLEFSEAKSIQLALSQLEVASNEKLTQHPKNLLSFSTLLFVAACADADLYYTEGNSFFVWFLPQVEGGLIVPPLRRWMKYVKQLLGVKTQKETTDILLGYQSEGSSRDREGKKLWAFGGTYEPQKSKSKSLYLPSDKQFTKMIKAASEYVEVHKPENAQYVNVLKYNSLYVTFFSNLYTELAELNLNHERMMIFDDYPYFYQSAQNTKGPPQKMSGSG